MTDGLVLMVATDAFISAGTTSPRKRRHEARYWESGPRGSHLIMKLAGSKAAAVICGVVCCSWPVLPLEMTGAYACIMKWRRGYGTRFVWNSLRSTVQREGQLGLVRVVLGHALEEQSSGTTARTSTNTVVDEEALETSALVGQAADLVHHLVDDLLADGVVTASVVGRRVLLVADHGVGVEHGAVLADLDLVAHGRLEVHEHATGDIAVSDLSEESVVGIVLLADRRVVGVGPVFLDTVFQGEQFPSVVAHLDAALAESDGDNFTRHVG